MHPEIRKFFEQGGHLIESVIHSDAICYTSDLRISNINPLAMIYTNGESIYWVDGFGKPYTESEMLRIIKLKVFY